MDGMKNISKAEVLTLRDQVAYQSGQVGSRTLAQNEHVSVTLFSFDKGEEISTHESGGDAMVTCLDGVGRITIDGVEHILHEGESIVMPARHPHAVYGQEQFKMLLVVVFRSFYLPKRCESSLFSRLFRAFTARWRIIEPHASLRGLNEASSIGPIFRFRF